MCIEDIGGRCVKDNKAIEADMTRKLFHATFGVLTELLMKIQV
jgi:hypothetical protein